MWTGRLRLWQATRDSRGTGSGGTATAAKADPDAVRAAMRQLLAGLEGLRSARLALAVDSCRDIAGLWHLRGPLLEALSAAGGELQARQQLAELDTLFVAAWPQAPVSGRRFLL